MIIMQNQTSSSSNYSGSVVAPPSAPQFAPSAPGSGPMPSRPVTSAPDPYAPKKSHGQVIETIILVLVSLVAVAFIALFVWKYLEWETLRTDVDGQIDAAVATAVAENTTKLEADFVEREKYPYKTFTGPADYGSLSFEYPRTWSVYIAKDTSTGGDYEAYLNPAEVQPIGLTTINALRVTIRNATFDTIVRNYENYVKQGILTLTTRQIGSAVANVYTGKLPNNLQGILTIFKLRDKTVMIQTDAELFATEYYKLLDTVTFVE